MSSFGLNKLNVIGIIVTFDPQIDPISSVTQILDSLSHLIIVDNCPGNHPLLGNFGCSEKVSIIKNSNIGGLAGAYNAALSTVELEHPEATHILYLDDDTDMASVREFLGSKNTAMLANDPKVAAVAPIYVERTTGLRCAPIMLNRFSYKMFPRTLSNPTQVSFLINSMSLWRVDAIRRIGKYSTVLAVDHIDTDYCLRAALHGYQLVIDPTLSFNHSIGKRRSYTLLGKTLQSGGHSPARRRMIARNTVLLAKRYGWNYPSFAFLCLMRLCYEVVGITIAEDESVPKLSATFKGALSGMFGRYR